MDFTDAPKKPKAESIVPMINVVFLLLIFFLMTAQIVAPDPFELTPPTASDPSQPAENRNATLYVGRNGTLSFQDRAGDAAFERIAEQAATISTLQLRADAALDGARLAKIMTRLSQAGIAGIELVVLSQ